MEVQVLNDIVLVICEDFFSPGYLRLFWIMGFKFVIYW